MELNIGYKDLARVPTVERFEAELEDWIPSCSRPSERLTTLENTGDIANGVMSARKTLAGVLQEMENARHFIAVKKDFLQTFAPADVETLFLDDRSVRQIGVPEASRRSPGEDTSG